MSKSLIHKVVNISIPDDEGENVSDHLSVEVDMNFALDCTIPVKTKSSFIPFSILDLDERLIYEY